MGCVESILSFSHTGFGPKLLPSYSMKIAAALAQQDEDDDEEGGEDEGSVAGPGAQHISPVPPMPNGRTA